MFGNTLRLCRKHAGLTQEELGEKLYLSRSVLSKYETDQLNISANLLMKWLEATNRRDLIIPIVHGVDLETINKKCFSDEYFNSEEYRRIIKFIEIMDKIKELDGPEKMSELLKYAIETIQSLDYKASE